MMSLRLELRKMILSKGDSYLRDLQHQGILKERLGFVPSAMRNVQGQLNQLRNASQSSGDAGPLGLGMISSFKRAMATQAPPQEEKPDKKKKKRVGKLQEDYEEPQPGRSHLV